MEAFLSETSDLATKIFCTKCGLLAAQQLKGLALPCMARSAYYAKPHAKVNLIRLARGELTPWLPSPQLTLACSLVQ